MNEIAASTEARFQTREFDLEGKLLSDDWIGATERDVKTHLFYRRRYLGAGRIEVIDLISKQMIQAIERNHAWAKWVQVR